jgi:hypothetical protein
LIDVLRDPRKKVGYPERRYLDPKIGHSPLAITGEVDDLDARAFAPAASISDEESLSCGLERKPSGSEVIHLARI